MATGAVAQEKLPRSAESTRQAWQALKSNNYTQALQLTEQVITEFRGSARAKQREIADRVKAGENAPPIGSVTREVFDRVMENGPLNDVGACYVIRGRAFLAMHDRSSALTTFREGRELTFARAWDSNSPDPEWNRNGWFWSTAMAADEGIRDVTALGEVIAFGNLAWRENNLTSADFRSPVGLYDTEVRLLLGTRSQAPNLRPYLTLQPAWSSKNISVENTFTYGIGVENRPLSRSYSLATRAELEWLTRVRLYAEYLRQGFFRSANPSWNPRENLIVGFDLWRQYGFEDPDRPDNNAPIWGELFVGGGYHTTNFYIRNYDAFRFGLNAKLGAKLGNRKLPILPYVYLDLNMSSRYADQFFNNRLIGGIGVRTELRFVREGRLWVFVEYRGILQYLKDSPPVGVSIPDSELRAGISFQFSRY
jgi:hypothetical protein